ncbi:MAG: TetR/AcrR family transcriptional regulator [Ignavibacteriales bacterium]|jgi:AcrR family transcriptional regulator|nr:TetR/AcrR family transcriptional regulator [Bacteriovorax sp.]MCZ2142018.1 TetR/AcrR family transcriptional regulator [Ignavibacteriales bacterium]
MKKKPIAKSPRIYKSAKSDIINTAKMILIKEGMGKLTTDNLIEKSGLSKGGFFYHFKTIESLILAVSDALMQDLQHDIVKIAANDPIKKGAHLRAYINLTFDDTADHIALGRSLIEVIFNKAYTKDYIKYFDELMARFYREDLDKITIMSIVLTLDGYWYNSILGIEYYSPKEIKKLHQHLLKQTL